VSFSKTTLHLSKAKHFLFACFTLAWAFLPKAAWGCSVCYGKSDSELAKGFNWGVISLLFVVLFVLGGFVAFFIYIAKRSAALAQNATAPLADATQKI
jgi:hypothetical protein